MKKLSYILFVLFFQYGYTQVGVGTTNPQQKLHIASPTGTLRIESHDYLNNVHNGGDSDNDGDYTNNSYPLFVDENGDLTLLFRPLINSEHLDAFDDTTLPNSSITLLPVDLDGEEHQIIKTYTITVSKPSILELKYNISFDVYLDLGHNIITDGLARRIDSFITVTGQSRKYGATSKCYSSTSVNSISGAFFNSCTTYITLPDAGTYDININGGVASNTTASNNGDNSLATHVEFATGSDFIFARLH